MPDILLAILALAILAALIVLITRLAGQSAAVRALEDRLARSLEEKHRAMLTDLHGGLVQQSERLTSRLSEELNQTRETLHKLELSLGANLGETADKLNAKIDQRLEQISGKVSERLDEGFKKTNETFVNVMERLATIDEAQKKIETLTGSVVSLQELLGNKQSRGAFGEVQLEALVRNVMPAAAFELQHTLSNGSRADCVLKLPDPTGLVCVDSKFPLENYHRMLAPGVNDLERAAAQRLFRSDVKKHVDDIAKKYILPGETSDGAVMFVPAEAVFAEIHAYHSEVVDHANAKRVWIVSPTTLLISLRTIASIWRYEYQNRNAQELVRQCTALYDKFVGFVTDLEDIGKRLKAAQSSYDDAYGKLASGKGNLIRQVERIRELGLKPAKLLPGHLTEVSVEDEAAAQQSLPH